MAASLPYNLRGDLQLLTAEADNYGFPQWLIYDPSRHKYFLIGWLEFEILSRWELNSFEAIVDSINRETTLNINDSHIYSIINFLYENELVSLDRHQDLSTLKLRSKKSSLLKGFIFHYLFFMIPVFKPERFLNFLYPLVKILFFNKWSKYLFSMLCVLDLYLIIRYWEPFTNTFDYMFSFNNVVIFSIAIIIVKICHELGHALMARHFNCKVATIGIAFIVLWPILYTDTTDAWKLKNKNHRLLIAAGGMIAELIIAILAIFVWHIVPHGISQTICFFIATISLASSILVNTNPLMKFDGYYLFADLIGIDNLQQTAFSLAKWRLRELLFYFNDPAPILYPKKKERLLLTYAYFTWIYRFFLFLSIAIMVYFYFFKVLGLILMLVEIFYFIVVPIITELHHYWLKRKNMKLNKNTLLTITTFLLLSILFLFPWHTHIKAPALIEYGSHAKVFSQVNGQIQQVSYKSGEAVDKDHILMQLTNPTLLHQLKLTTDKIDLLQIKIRQEQKTGKKLGYKQTTQQELSSLQNQLQNLLEESEKLAIKAPISGEFYAEKPSFKPGVWIGKKSLIGEIINPYNPLVIAYVSEEDIHRVKLGNAAIFYASDDALIKRHLIVSKIDRASIERLPNPYLSSLYGGALASSKDSQGEIVLKEALFRVQFSFKTPPAPIHNIIRGKVVIMGKKESYLNRVWKKIVTIFIKESVF